MNMLLRFIFTLFVRSSFRYPNNALGKITVLFQTWVKGI